MNEQELRELDAWIFEKVIGWTIKSRQNPHSGSVTEHFWYEPGNDIAPKHQSATQTMSPSGRIVGDKFPKETPHYTTDPAEAMEVLKKCAEKIGSCEQFTVRWDDGQWVVGQDPSEVGYQSESGYTAETLELAICLFAKKLFEGKAT